MLDNCVVHHFTVYWKLEEPSSELKWLMKGLFILTLLTKVYKKNFFYDTVKLFIMQSSLCGSDITNYVTITEVLLYLHNFILQ